MTADRIVVKSHLKANNPPPIDQLKIVLEEVIKTIYGDSFTLEFEEADVGDNEFENMVHFYSSLNSGIRHHIEGILDRKFGPHFVVGYNGETDGYFTAELDEAERKINARLYN